MKLKNSTPGAVLALGLVLAGCSSTPVTPPPAPAPAPVAQAPAPAAPAPAPQTQVAKVEVPAHLDPKSLISTDRSVYFDFDNFAVKPQYDAMLQRHGQYLAKNAQLAVKVEGSADERGSAEYNLALGQKRAEAVVKALKAYGVRDAQMEAISWGKEHPKATGHDEAAWAQNRRADIAYPQR
ncbi:MULTISPECIES: peptidoglycan-associated lipoprotein Pal [Roseateles]|uniref:Peptidoglycan-associated lipoprotein n=1 Tax=Pelomonas caseinilytica TaxID=2906763 RepID=A0ABS8XB06_9BURK|nr:MULTISPECIES: peptidoglycan-associated lipoprotein Pal [unclassified Roseateles]MCE4536512.1 peptidoglycan-associated lipoprotein Pal [Pelomonas sp. P7]HEV6965990.1 peptidoglycan-associated lipoprotein Pal [Roseateles sp.]